MTLQICTVSKEEAHQCRNSSSQGDAEGSDGVLPSPNTVAGHCESPNTSRCHVILLQSNALSGFEACKGCRGAKMTYCVKL